MFDNLIAGIKEKFNFLINSSSNPHHITHHENHYDIDSAKEQQLNHKTHHIDTYAYYYSNRNEEPNSPIKNNLNEKFKILTSLENLHDWKEIEDKNVEDFQLVDPKLLSISDIFFENTSSSELQQILKDKKLSFDENEVLKMLVYCRIRIKINNLIIENLRSSVPFHENQQLKTKLENIDRIISTTKTIYDYFNIDYHISENLKDEIERLEVVLNKVKEVGNSNIKTIVNVNCYFGNLTKIADKIDLHKENADLEEIAKHTDKIREELNQLNSDELKIVKYIVRCNLQQKLNLNKFDGNNNDSGYKVSLKAARLAFRDDEFDV